jgi:pyridoxine 5-phosphate synthase
MPPLPFQRLGVNIDHVATVRNARGTPTPDPLRAALLAAKAGADGITAHLREDRRHIVDDDIARLKDTIGLPLNFEMAATEEMLAIALRHRPHAACIVPEKREERTTEGGLDAVGQHNHLKPLVSRLSDAGIRVSLFIEADPRQLEMAVTLGAPVVELHTGRYCEIEGAETMSVRSPPSPMSANSISATSWSARRSSSASRLRSARCAG